MIRKIVLFAAFLLTLTAVSAQSVGEWNVFTRFRGFTANDEIIETPQKVYYTSGNRLFSLDNNSNESYAYTSQNKLNDTDISLVKYNPVGKYLFIGYNSGNIDLLYDNGRVVNLNDILNATLTGKKGINSVSFGKDRIYVGTKFGMVIYDDNKHEVVESGIYDKSVTGLAELGDFLFIQLDGDNLMYAPLKAHHNTISKYDVFQDPNTNNYIHTLWLDVAEDGKTLLYGDKDNKGNYTAYTFDVSGKSPVFESIERYDWQPAAKVLKTPKGAYAYTKDKIYMLDANGRVSNTINIPPAVAATKLATLCDESSVWIADNEGIGHYDISNGQLTVLSDKFKPEGIVTDEVFFVKIDNWGNIWTNNIGATLYKGGDSRDSEGGWPAYVSRIVGKHPEDMTLYGTNGASVVPSSSDIAIDPEIPNRYYLSTNHNGVYVLEKDEATGKVKELGRITKNNAPIPGAFDWYQRVYVVQFDQDGNLWLGNHCYDQASPGKVSSYCVLPREILRSKSISEIQTSDWKVSKHAGDLNNPQAQKDDGGNKDMGLIICKHSPTLITFSVSYQHAIGITHTNGTLADTSDDFFFEYTKPVDQDGKIWMPDVVVSGVEDHRGRVWLGGDTGGIVEISDPSKTSPNNPTVKRIKVPRNDGTHYADYLCETDLVYAIAVDNSNRKWIATETSGVYLVSEDGDEIIEHFTTDNSPLPSNEVLAVACDPNSNTVYFGLKAGLVSYNSTSSPAAPDYSDIYAYPNPVRPDFTGYITITGLKDNSLVKITDNIGNVVYQTRSEGGMAVWDGFDTAHNPAKSGVYYVFASEGENGGSQAAVTKIMIIR